MVLSLAFYIYILYWRLHGNDRTRDYGAHVGGGGRLEFDVDEKRGYNIR